MELKDKVVVITGGGRGLGLALGTVLAEHGAKVVLADLRKDELEISAAAIGAQAIVCDVADPSSVAQLATQVEKMFGRIDIWFNNAGIWMPYSPIETLDLDRVHALINVNFFGTLNGSREAMARMKRQGGGAIVNIISIRATQGKPLTSGYTASKYAADGFTKVLRNELEGSGVLVIGVYPNRIKTGLFEGHQHADSETMMEPSDAANAIVKNLLLDSPELTQII